jgi:hypothetical protein
MVGWRDRHRNSRVNHRIATPRQATQADRGNLRDGLFLPERGAPPTRDVMVEELKD